MKKMLMRGVLTRGERLVELRREMWTDAGAKCALSEPVAYPEDISPGLEPTGSARERFDSDYMARLFVSLTSGHSMIMMGVDEYDKKIGMYSDSVLVHGGRVDNRCRRHVDVDGLSPASCHGGARKVVSGR